MRVRRQELGSNDKGRGRRSRLPQSTVHSLQPTFPAGFTLLELLVVVSIMTVLMGLLLPAILKAKNNSREKRAQVQTLALAAAIDAYILEYHHLPAPVGDLDDGVDYYYGPMEPVERRDPPEIPGSDYPQHRSENNADVFDALVDANPPVVDRDVFHVDANGNVIDPWGKPYRIYLDLNNDRWIDFVRYKKNQYGDIVRVADSRLHEGARNGKQDGQNDDQQEFRRYVIKRDTDEE